jgi:hypothetical protein
MHKPWHISPFYMGSKPDLLSIEWVWFRTYKSSQNYLHMRGSSMMELREHNKDLCTPRQKVLGWSIRSVPKGKTSIMHRQEYKVEAEIFITILSRSSPIFQPGCQNPDTELHTPHCHTISMPAVSCVSSQCIERKAGRRAANLKLSTTLSAAKQPSASAIYDSDG